MSGTVAPARTRTTAGAHPADQGVILAGPGPSLTRLTG